MRGAFDVLLVVFNVLLLHVYFENTGIEFKRIDNQQGWPDSCENLALFEPFLYIKQQLGIVE